MTFASAVAVVRTPGLLRPRRPGESTTVTITGTGFMPTTNANSCAPTTPSITAGSENVALSNINVVSPTEITLTAAPQASDPLEAASITVANYSLNGPPYYLNSNAKPAEILPIPTIQWNNNTISGAKAQMAVVGQPINLTTTPTAAALAALPAPLAISKSTWVAGGTNIAGYLPSAGATAGPTATVLTNTTFSSYWIYSGSGLKVTYIYCINAPNQLCSPTTTATFNISGQGTAKMSVGDYGAATIENLYVLPSCTSSSTAPYLGYGKLTGPGPECGGAQTGTPGITFTASGASTGGNYSFVQTISSDSRTYVSASGSVTCNTTPGLDTSYPYKGLMGANGAEDGPEIPLPDLYTNGSRSFGATMYVLWTSTVANAIPVPLGYQQWHFQASTTNPGAPTTASWTTPVTQAHGKIGNFVPATSSSQFYGYPTWGGLATEMAPCSN